MECVGIRRRAWSSRIALPAIRAIAQCTQDLARFLKVTAPEQRGSLGRETIGLVGRHLPVGDNDASGGRHAGMGEPPRLECLAVFDPMNGRNRGCVGHFNNG
jgi:hypothetical protein